MDIEAVSNYLLGLQDQVCQMVKRFEAQADFIEDHWQRAIGQGRTRALADGQVFEKAGVNFSRVAGNQLPPAATSTRKISATGAFDATGMSLVLHPRNPHVPTVHCNLRFFTVKGSADAGEWWFGGGYDLTPYYPYKDDVIAWHQAAHQACQPFGEEVYLRYKRWCDEYFYLKHRNERRGVGGLFFDDLNEWGFDKSFAFLRSVGDSFSDTYRRIVERRCDTPYGEREREFQLYRRGRYVEFNLVYDRGTLFGLQSGGRVESILMSLPPCVKWQYNWKPEKGSPEQDLYLNYLQPQDWLGLENK